MLQQARELLDKNVSAQLLNNIGVLHHTKADLDSAQSLYQSAWEGAVKLEEERGSGDTQDMLITLSYNLGRLQEDMGNVHEAKKTYEGLLLKHPDYIDGTPFCS